MKQQSSRSVTRGIKLVVIGDNPNNIPITLLNYATYNGQCEDIPQNAPKVFVELMKRCWAENPSDRPASQQILLYMTGARWAKATIPKNQMRRV